MLALIVIDCAEHSLLESLMLQGRLPTLASLAEVGLTVPLASDGDALDGSVNAQGIVHSRRNCDVGKPTDLEVAPEGTCVSRHGCKRPTLWPTTS